ncbi:MAG: hypothetical protein ACLQNE_42895 [Thermoguttaceae bacterium]
MDAVGWVFIATFTFGATGADENTDGAPAGFGTLMGWLHAGQGTVFPNAFSVTFNVLMQRGQLIVNDIARLPNLRPRANEFYERIVVKTGGTMKRVLLTCPRFRFRAPKVVRSWRP